MEWSVSHLLIDIKKDPFYNNKEKGLGAIKDTAALCFCAPIYIRAR